MKNKVIDELNTRLAKQYGKNLLGQPHFRLVWSEDLYETRVGQFNIFSGPIFLRTHVGAKQVKKYNYIKERWILEMWKLAHCQPTIELPEPDGYECIYLFEDRFERPLPVVFEKIEKFLFFVLNPQMDYVQMKQYLEDVGLKMEQDDINYFDQMISDNSSYELHKRHFGERISNAGIIIPEGVDDGKINNSVNSTS